MAFAGIDLGGTYVKAGLVHPDDGSTTLVQRTPAPYERSGRVADRVDVDALLALVGSEITRLVGAGARGVLISNQMHGVVLVDPHLAPVSPMYTWQADLATDLPGGSEALVAALGGALGDHTRRALGNELRQGLPIATLACLAQQPHGIPAGSVALSIGDFVASSLCGAVVACHASNAAASGLFDLAEGTWSGAAVAAIRAEGMRLPGVITSPAVVGEAHIASATLPVVCAIGDQQAALIGAELSPDELSVNAATGCQVSRRLETPDTSVPQLRPFVRHDYLATVTHIPAGRALNAFVRLLASLDPGDDLEPAWARLEKAAGNARGSIKANVAVFPAAAGFPAGLTGLTEHNMTPGSVFRAAMEDVADRIAAAAHALGTEGLTGIAFSGGLVYRSALMRQLITDRLPLPARVVSEDADALTGLAHIAAGISDL
jgi:sugar (pentulose or hexulose) kinase